MHRATIRKNHVRYKIDQTADSLTYRLYKERGEKVSHIVSECKKLVQTDYKRGHDNVAKMTHWKLCISLRLKDRINGMNTAQKQSQKISLISFCGHEYSMRSHHCSKKARYFIIDRVEKSQYLLMLPSLETRE